MKKELPFVKVPGRLLPIVGEPDPGTRMYKRVAERIDRKEWWDAIWEICGKEGSMSPGGVAGYCKVSRAGVHKRMKEGRITAFVLYMVTETKFMKKKVLDEGGRPFDIQIPVSECKAWAEDIAERKARIGIGAVREDILGDGDEEGEFMKPSRQWKKDKLKK
jgi:hypothetical protein